MATMTSRERMLSAINHTEPDHVPLIFNFLDPDLPPHVRFTNWLERVDRFLAIGADDWLTTDIPWRMHPEVTTEAWSEQPEGERYPVLHKVYHTPKGDLVQVARKTEDWVDGDEIALVSNHNIPRSLRFLVEAEEHLERMKYIFMPPSDEQIREFREQARELKRAADQRGVIVVGHSAGGSDLAVHICGLDNFLIDSKLRPWFVKEVLRILHDWEMKRLTVLLETGVCDIITRSGWSESTSHWSPAGYREFLYDHVREGVDLTHQAGLKHLYGMHTGLMPLIPTLLDLGTDILSGVDPVQGGADLARLKRECGARICFIGGMNSYLTLGRGTREEIREAVGNAIHTLGPGGGFILFPVDALDRTTPWSSVEILLEAWKEWRDYPLRV